MTRDLIRFITITVVLFACNIVNLRLIYPDAPSWLKTMMVLAMMVFSMMYLVSTAFHSDAEKESKSDYTDSVGTDKDPSLEATFPRKKKV